MRRFLVFFVAAALICPAVSLSAQSGDGAGRQNISDDDRAAVAAYNEATGKLNQKIRAARKAIREKNSELAKALGREKAEYDEKDVVAAHKALTEAYTAMVEAELEGLLLYKAYHPQWKPEDDGRRVAAPTERESARAGDSDQAQTESPSKPPAQAK